jgi:hypothetical protein
MGGVANTARIALWDVSPTVPVWVSISSGMTGGVQVVRGLAHTRTGELYAIGEWDTIDGTTADSIARYDGQAWFALSSGINGQGTDIAIAPDENIYIGGTATLAGGQAIFDGMAIWNGSSFAPLDVNLPGSTALVSYAFRPAPVVVQNFSTYVGFDNTGGGTIAGLTTATNGGTEFAYPQIVIARTGGTSLRIKTIRNEITGKTLWSNYTLLDGETLTIETSPRAQSIVSSFFGDKPGAVLAGSALGEWGLQQGANSITLYTIPGGGSVTTAYLLWRDTYWSIDD